MDWIIANIPAWNSVLGLVLYWMPLLLCAYGYVIEFIQLYRSDLRDRAAAESVNEEELKRQEDLLGRRIHTRAYYSPTLTVGWIVGRIFVTVIPIVNLFTAVFNVAPKVFGDIFTWVGKALDMPLVPARKK